jgi:transposase
MEHTYRSQIFDHLGLVAGMFDERGMGDVVDNAPQHNPAMRDLTVGEAVKAMVLNGLGCAHHARYLVPRFFENNPTSCLIAPRVTPTPRHDAARGRALETLYADGVTELSSLIAATAATRLGLAATFAHLDTTSLHVDGRYNSAAEPDAEVMHITRGYSRDQRPDLNHVMLELSVEHQAGMPVLMQPLSGHTRDGKTFGHVVQAPMTP